MKTTLYRAGLAVFAAATTATVPAQTEGPLQSPAPAKRSFTPETSVSLGAAAQLTATRTGPYGSNTPGSQGFDPSAAVLFSLRQSSPPIP